MYEVLDYLKARLDVKLAVLSRQVRGFVGNPRIDRGYLQIVLFVPINHTVRTKFSH